MRKYKRAGVLIVLLLIINFSSQAKLIPDVLKFQSKPTNYLTGLPGSNGSLLAVKIDDTKEAHPQIGIDDADVVYVEQVESGLTRLLALFSSKYPDAIGPVRSARISDIDLLAQYGRIAFAYSGSQSKMRPVLAAANLNNLSAERNPPSIFSRDEGRTAPVNMILYPTLLLDHARSKLKMNLITMQKSPWSFGESSRSAIPNNSAKIQFPNSRYEIAWNNENECWNLSQDGNIEITSAGKILCVDNVIIQIVVIEPSMYGDKFGGITPLSKTVGSGFAYLLRDGKFLKVQWQRNEPSEFTNWLDSDGKDVNLKPGKTWIFLTDTAPKLIP